MASLSWNHTGAAQAQHSQDEQCVYRCAHAGTYRHTDAHTHTVPSSSSELPFLLHFLSLPSRKGAAAAAAEVPGVQNAQ